MINDKGAEEILNFIDDAKKQLAKIIETCEEKMADEKEVKHITVVDTDNIEHTYEVTEGGSVDIHGDWLVVMEDDIHSAGGHRIATVKFWRVDQ